MTLGPPGGDRGIVVRSVQREVELHIPLERIDRLAGAADAQIVAQLLGHGIRERVPVPGRGLRVGTVRPELGDGRPKSPSFTTLGS